MQSSTGTEYRSESDEIDYESDEFKWNDGEGEKKLKSYVRAIYISENFLFSPAD
jgi:hypothetical protein